MEGEGQVKLRGRKMTAEFVVTLWEAMEVEVHLILEAS